MLPSRRNLAQQLVPRARAAPHGSAVQRGLRRRGVEKEPPGRGVRGSDPRCPGRQEEVALLPQALGFHSLATGLCF